jgi:hypothetical protein
MALPQAEEARTYYRVAKQRFDDGVFLLEADRTTAGVYLAGYGVECMLKALVLAHLAPKKRKEMLRSFRGPRAHDFDWLKKQLMRIRSISIPSAISGKLSLVNTWNTELRYKAGTIPNDEAERFISAVESIMQWTDGRLS